MEGITFAGRDGKDTLYKFRAFNDDEMKARVREIVLGHTIYFSRRCGCSGPEHPCVIRESPPRATNA
jgi:hypothetical protein